MQWYNMRPRAKPNLGRLGQYSPGRSSSEDQIRTPVARSCAPPDSALDACVVSVEAPLRCCFLYARSTCMCTNERASICHVVLGFGLHIFLCIFDATYSFHGGLSMRGKHGRERSGYDDSTCALTGHLQGRRSIKHWRRKSPLLQRVARIRSVVPMCILLLSTTLLNKKKFVRRTYSGHAECGIWGRSSVISTGLVLILRHACSYVNRNV